MGYYRKKRKKDGWTNDGNEEAKKNEWAKKKWVGEMWKSRFVFTIEKGEKKMGGRMVEMKILYIYYRKRRKKIMDEGTVEMKCYISMKKSWVEEWWKSNS